MAEGEVVEALKGGLGKLERLRLCGVDVGDECAVVVGEQCKGLEELWVDNCRRVGGGNGGLCLLVSSLLCFPYLCFPTLRCAVR